MITPRIQRALDDLAADTSTEWELMEGEKIRTGYGDGPVFWCCPLSWLGRFSYKEWRLAALGLGLLLPEAEALVSAADNTTYDSHLRSELLRACRLSETA